jgi:hypothetical protein
MPAFTSGASILGRTHSPWQKIACAGLDVITCNLGKVEVSQTYIRGRPAITRNMCSCEGKVDTMATSDPARPKSKKSSGVQRFRSIVQYDGADFSGFQRQANIQLFARGLRL